MNEKNEKHRMNEKHEMNISDGGDITRQSYIDGCTCVASCASWTAFYALRNVASWAQLGPTYQGQYSAWVPVCGSWEALTDVLEERFGSSVHRWWETPAVWTCAVCQDRGQFQDGLPCPICCPREHALYVLPEIAVSVLKALQQVLL